MTAYTVAMDGIWSGFDGEVQIGPLAPDNLSPQHSVLAWWLGGKERKQVVSLIIKAISKQVFVNVRAWDWSWLQDCRPLSQSWQTTTTFVSYFSTLAIWIVACPGVIYVRPSVNTVFIDKHYCSSVLMLRTHRLELFLLSFVCTANSFTCFRSQLKNHYVRNTFVASPPSAPLIHLPRLSHVINSLITYLMA